MNEEKKETPLESKEKSITINEEEVTTWGFIKDIIKFTLLSLTIVIPIRVFVAQPFLVSGSSMKPTFHDGEYLIVDELSYYFNSPNRGQVIVFKYPYDLSKYFIKRIIGLPGETVEINNNQIIIKNAKHPDGFALGESYIIDKSWGNRTMSIALNKEEYFVMGDNRNASSDSREWGPLDSKFITGHVLVRLLPISQAEISPGAVEKFKSLNQ
ncbi:MAG: signal peptidase I [Candidatus Vogelbacteria bacterium]|nr:signal peptidase I [Candidatus Vogelbacteria bacterium]